MLSEQALQNLTISITSTLLNFADYAIKIHTKNGMIYQMHSTRDQSLRYKIVENEQHVGFCFYNMRKKRSASFQIDRVSIID